MSDAASVEGGRRRPMRYWRSPVAVWAVLLGVLVHFAGFFAFDIDIPANEPATVPPPEIYYTGTDEQLNELMQEQSDLLDFEPLFLPTSRNASVYLGWNDLVERTEPFSPLPPRLLISEDHFPSPQEERPESLEQPEQMLERDIAGSFGAFGQMATGAEALELRGGVVEIYREGELQPIDRKQLPDGVIDEAVNNLSGLLEWRLVVDDVGVVGQPLLIRGSGLEAVDAASAKYLLQVTPQWGLHSGYYRLLIGP